MILVPATVPQKVRDELHTHYLRIKPFVSADLLWERVLTKPERRRLGGNIVEAHAKLGTVGMWQKVRGGSQARALVEVAQALGFLDQTTQDWLLREIGERPRSRRDIADRPTWDIEKGELRFREEVIRTVRVMGTPSNIQLILDAFQAVKWKRQIGNPMRSDPQRLHQALRSLNKNLTRIRFRSAKGGHVITWEVS